MQRIDPLTPGRRLETVGGDAEVVALTEAFNEMLDRLETERRESARRTLEAQEMERQRIARELHDEIGQTLTGLALRSETIARRAPREIRDELEDMREAARRGAEDARTIARRLRPEALDELGLRSALMALTASVAEQSGLVVERSFSEDQELSGDQELVVYRVAQEGLTNVVRHALRVARTDPFAWRRRGRLTHHPRRRDRHAPGRRDRCDRHPRYARAGSAGRR
jgi:two-component system sensor histidine kinase UhpB